MIDFGIWPLREAKRYRDQYAAAVPLREQWLASELAMTGGNPAWLDRSEGLADLWTWATRRIDTEGPTELVLATVQPDGDPQPGPRPPWHAQDKQNPYLSDGVLWLVDLLGCHLAALVLDELPDARWDLYRAPSRRRDVQQNRTVLVDVASGRSDPAQMVYGEVIDHVYHGEPWRKDALGWLHTFLVTGTY